MENKYQEALDSLKEIEREYTYTKIGSKFHVNCDTLQELVDKETPMKPIIKNVCNEVDGDVDYGVCPNCEYPLDYSFNHCPYCGQALDWSDE